MPRPRLYVNGADKARAYRLRKKLVSFGISPSSDDARHLRAALEDANRRIESLEALLAAKQLEILHLKGEHVRETRRLREALGKRVLRVLLED
jgi:hypothetical protein